MENIRINVAELLKDCPQGMELDCTIYEDVHFDYVDERSIIHCYIQCETYKTSITFHRYGSYNVHVKSKCVIFPKGKTTWEDFQRPFKDGDIIYVEGFRKWVAIVKLYDDSAIYEHVALQMNNATLYFSSDIPLFRYGDDPFEIRFATEEEKQKLFDAIKANGFKWNEETKTLEKLIEPKFKVGDVIQDKDSYKVTITNVHIEDECYGYQSVISKGIGGIRFNEQDEWELVPNKFDISTLKPFDKVLGRTNDTGIWECDLFSCYNDSELLYKFHCIGVNYRYCIPYNGNEHLLGKADDCDEYYKTWEK